MTRITTPRADGETGHPRYETKHQLSVPRIANPAIFDSNPIRGKRASRRRGSAHAGQKSASGNVLLPIVNVLLRIASQNGPKRRIVDS